MLIRTEEKGRYNTTKKGKLKFETRYDKEGNVRVKKMKRAHRRADNLGDVASKNKITIQFPRRAKL